MDDRFVVLNPIPQSKPFPAPSEARTWSTEELDATLQSQFAGLASRANGYGDCSLGNDVACLLRGTGPLSSLRKDRASLAAEIPTAASGLKPNLVAVFTNRRRQSALRRDILDGAVV